MSGHARNLDVGRIGGGVWCAESPMCSEDQLLMDGLAAKWSAIEQEEYRVDDLFERGIVLVDLLFRPTYMSLKEIDQKR